MEEFSFGTLATDELRLAQLKSQRRGVVHLNRIEPRDPLPGQPVAVIAHTGSDVSIASLTCRYTTDNSDPSGGQAFETPFEQTGIEWDTLTWGYLTSWRAWTPPQPSGTVVRYQVMAVPTGGGGHILADGGTTFSFLVDNDPPPAWAREAVVYQIFLDRFHPGNGNGWRPARSPAEFYGGTLCGVTEKMNYLADLGVNCLWLSPCFSSPSHHGYDATDLFTIEPRLGTLVDLKALVAEAHRHGVRILLDLAANHVSNQHPAFQSAHSDPKSPYWDWFIWKKWPDEYDSFFGVKELPEINLAYPAARQHVIEAAVFWVSECDVDGYRLDYAHGPEHDFWIDFRKAVRAAKPDSWLFGEVVETAELQRSFEGRLDGTLDFLLLQALRGAFAFGSWDVARLDAFLTAHEAYFPENFSRPSFLDNHDMNRFLWVTGGNTARLRLAALCQFTLAGPPIIYYGTEVGLSQERDIWQNGLGILEESRLPMLWGQAQDRDLLSYYRKLIKLRRMHPALRRGRRLALHVNAEAGTYAYAREDGSERLVVALNNNAKAHTIAVKRAPATDLLTGVTYPVQGGEAIISLEPWGGVLLGEK
ncbi:MAG: glycoside hydrolase family 13 protein [Anaerolineales bacterium]|nr:glycoside hydrolase family 13 protein [Anaerolineales bacterium]